METPAALPPCAPQPASTADLLTSMLRKKWIARETEAAPRDARRTVRYAVLVADARPPKLNDNQQAILAELAGSGRRAASCRSAPSRRSRIHSATLVKRGLVRIEERPAAFHLTLSPRCTVRQHVLNAAQQAALDTITAAR